LSLLTASLAAAISLPSSSRALVRSRAPAIVGMRPEAVEAFEEEGEEEEGAGLFHEEEELEELEEELEGEEPAAALPARSCTCSTKSCAFPRSSASQMPAEARDSETAAPRDSAAAAAAAAASASGYAFVVVVDSVFFVSLLRMILDFDCR